MHYTSGHGYQDKPNHIVAGLFAHMLHIGYSCIMRHNILSLRLMIYMINYRKPHHLTDSLNDLA